MSNRYRVLSGVLVISFFAGTALVLADPTTRLPAGHSYSPNQQKLPPLNSRRDRINAQADVYEAEINRINRETASTFNNMRIFGRDRFLSGDSSNRPRY